MSTNQEGYKVPETPLVLNPNYKPEVTADVEKKAEAESASSLTHTVQKNETLSAIAQRYLGSANRYPEIFKLNKDILKDPDHIVPGQVLKIPQGEAKHS